MTHREFVVDPDVVPFIAAIIHFAHCQALWAVSLWRVMIHPDSDNGKQLRAWRTPIPLGLAMELGAIAQIAQWERAGLRDFLPASLPAAEQAFDDFWQRLSKSPETYDER